MSRVVEDSALNSFAPSKLCWKPFSVILNNIKLYSEICVERHSGVSLISVMYILSESEIVVLACIHGRRRSQALERKSALSKCLRPASDPDAGLPQSC